MHFTLISGSLISFIGFQQDQPVKTPEIEEYSDDFLYDDLSTSTVTVGPNITDYEVNVFLFCFLISRTCHWQISISQILEYTDYKNDTELDYEGEEIYDDAFGFAERERAETWGGEVNLNLWAGAG